MPNTTKQVPSQLQASKCQTSEEVTAASQSMDTSIEQYLEMGVTGWTFKNASGLVVKSNIPIVGPQVWFLAGAQ